MAEPKNWMDERREAYLAKHPYVEVEQPTEIGVGVLVESESGFLGGVVAAGTEADTWIVYGLTSYLDEMTTRCYPTSHDPHCSCNGCRRDGAVIRNSDLVELLPTRAFFTTLPASAFLLASFQLNQNVV